MAATRLLPLLVMLLCSPTTPAEILSKSKLEKCVKISDSDKLDCSKKIVLNLAVPSGSSGGEASIVAELVEVEEENSTNQMQALRDPPVITINKSAAYALYEIMYLRDVAYKPQELFVKTRKCEPDAGPKVVQMCEALRDQNGRVIENTQPICCPCGSHLRVPSSCGNVFDKVLKGKPNTAHCLRFNGDWFHVFGIGRRSLGFSVRIDVKKGSKTSQVTVGPENRTVLSADNLLRVNLIGDFMGYTSLPSFEDFYLVIPRQGTAAGGLSQNLGTDFSRWMLLERVRFTLDGLECNRIGVSYEAYNGQPNFCSSPFWSCLHNQLWDFWEADQNRIKRNQPPQYVVQGRFERINQHPDAGPQSFSIGITEVLNTNLLIELSADDVQYVYQMSPGKIVSVSIPTFEAMTQFGVAAVTAKNVGELEASYSLVFDCSSGISKMEEQFFIMKPEEVAVRSFKLYPTTDQAAKYECAAVLKASDFSEVDRAECQFTTTTTVIDNGTQITGVGGPDAGGIHGFFGAIEEMWHSVWNGLIDFFTGRSCRSRCSGFFDFGCHIQYICVSWILLFGLLLAIFPTAIVLLWLLHQKGFFDPIYDWWEDRSGNYEEEAHHDHRHRSSAAHAHHQLHHHQGRARHHHAHNYKEKHHKHHHLPQGYREDIDHHQHVRDNHSHLHVRRVDAHKSGHRTVHRHQHAKTRHHAERDWIER